jgi:hypothetical protein
VEREANGRGGERKTRRGRLTGRSAGAAVPRPRPCNRWVATQAGRWKWPVNLKRCRLKRRGTGRSEVRRTAGADSTEHGPADMRRGGVGRCGVWRREPASYAFRPRSPRSPGYSPPMPPQLIALPPPFPCSTPAFYHRSPAVPPPFPRPRPPPGCHSALTRHDAAQQLVPRQPPHIHPPHTPCNHRERRQPQHRFRAAVPSGTPRFRSVRAHPGRGRAENSTCLGVRRAWRCRAG